MQFKSRLASQVAAKTRTKSIPDIIDAGLPPDAFITAEQLAEEFKIPREAVLQILDKASVWPIAKVLNRGAATEEHPNGAPKGGRPKMAFNPRDARTAISHGVETMYG